MAKKYWFVTRPPDALHGHPFVVYDCDARLHLELTLFGKESRVNPKTTKVYLYALLPYFTWLDTDERQVQSDSSWNKPPEQVRWVVEDYLLQQMGCQIQQHREGFQLVRPTSSTPTSVHMFLVALKRFYKVMKHLGRYEHPNPLVESSTELLATVEDYLDDENQYPPMPVISGVQEPNQRERLTDSYYKFVGDKWIPQIINDPHFPAHILQGGRSLRCWNLRAEVVTRILFETGSRVSEAVGLTIGDWLERGMKQEANTFSKGSNGRRVKFIRFSADTSKLLRRYFNQERIKYDSNSYILDNYLELAKHREIDLQTVPLFLTNRQTAFSPDNYRDNYWKPACQAASINADVHQARHWYVTIAIKQIHEISTTEGEVERRKRELKEYMKWRSEETMKAYDHYFDSLRHAEIQDSLHARMDVDLAKQLEEWQQGQQEKQSNIIMPTMLNQRIQTVLPEDEDLLYLLKIGRKNSDR